MKLSRQQKRNALLTLALGIVFAFYGALRFSRLHDTAALYIGLPLLLAVVVSVAETEKPTQTALKVLTIALALSPLIIGEGFICVLMASPILYAVTFFVTLLVEQIIKALKGKGGDKPLKSATGLLFIFLLSLEGTNPLMTVERYNEITVEKVVPRTVAQAMQSLSGPMGYEKRPSGFFTWLFLPPDRITGKGLAPGDRRVMTLTYNKWIVTNKWTGDTVFEVAEAGKDFVTFRLVEDKSYMDLYLQWHEATTRIEPVDNRHSKVKVTISYARKLDPSWYFGPMERSAVRDVAETIIDNL